LRLVNVATGQVVEIQPDNVREYRSPDFLILRCELYVGRQGVSLEPIIRYDERFARLETQMPTLLSEMRENLKESPLRREIVLL